MVCPVCSQRLNALLKPARGLRGLTVERRQSPEVERVAVERRAVQRRNPDTPEFHALEAERREIERRARPRAERATVSPWGLGKGYSDDAL